MSPKLLQSWDKTVNKLAMYKIPPPPKLHDDTPLPKYKLLTITAKLSAFSSNLLATIQIKVAKETLLEFKSKSHKFKCCLK